jgi:thioredoxin reductase/NAD-dependent dihydropyrimidine dehydrogenase PreA subunit
MSLAAQLAIYVVPTLALLGWYVVRRRRHEGAHAKAFADAVACGMTEPPSLHPVVDPAACIGSGSCVRACPERAIGLIDGKAVLANPAACIGHGACEAACPVRAITLVYGSERRGVDIPVVAPDFESNVAGIYIAGELGGMGLIRKASEQGAQAVRAIAGKARAKASYDVVIVGAGPAGIAAALAAQDAKLRYAVLEQEGDLGGSVLHYPRQKIAMTAPVTLPVIGKVKFAEVSKETLLAFWKGVVERARLQVRFGQRMDRVEAAAGGVHRVITQDAVYETASVVLAIGRRGSPRKLDIPGEALPKVVYRLMDPEQYRGSRVLVVGGGDSAIEAAVACAAEPGTRVTLAYRGDAFNRVKPANRERVSAMADTGALEVRLNTVAESIDANHVVLRSGEARTTIANDAVIVQAGGVLPTALLQSMGVRVETKHGEA